MFGVGPGEIAVILVILAVIVGPSQLPRMAEGLGKSIHILRRDAKQLRKEFDETKEDLKTLEKEIS
jgi:TatA/E family protein of Tat protein translocase